MLHKYIDNPYRALSFSRSEKIYLLCLTIAGTIIRIIYHYNRPFVGDEVGTLLYIEKSIPFILSHFELWLTMNYFILAEKILLQLAGYHQAVLSLIPLLAGMATIPLTALVAKQFTSTKTALIAATLAAINGYLIYFSGVIRSYSLLTAISLIVFILFFRWLSNQTYKNGAYVALSCYILMLSHLNGIYTLAYILFIAGVDTLDRLKKRQKTKVATLLIPLFVSMLLGMVSYMKIIPQFLVWGIPWHDVHPTSISYIPYTFSEFFGNGSYGWLSMVLLISGILIAFKQEKPSLIVLPSVILPIMLISIQGISHFPWAYSRFMIFTLPIYIIFIAEGIQFFSSLLSPRNSDGFSFALTLIVFITWIPNIYTGFGSQSGYRTKLDYPWNQVASFITKSSRIDAIFYNSGREMFNLTPYFSKSLYPQSQLHAFGPETFTPVEGNNVYFVTAGPSIASNYPKYMFGEIQVIVYPSDNYLDQLQMIRSDLLKSANLGKISPELADVYLNVWEISKRLGQGNAENFFYYDLYMRCFQLTVRQRNIPLSLQYWELEQSGYQVLSPE